MKGNNRILKIVACCFLLEILFMVSVFLYDSRLNFIEPSYKNISERNIELLASIKHDYGISVFLYENPFDYFPNRGFYIVDKNVSFDDERLFKYLNSLYKRLGIYNDFAVSLMPKKMFLVYDIYSWNNDLKKQYNGLYYRTGLFDFVMLDSKKFYAYTLHHELFHAFYENNNFVKEVSDSIISMDGCERISSYACSSQKEMVAEAWGFSFIKDDDIPQYNSLKNSLYSLLLKAN